jgi:hypothetical protein
VIHQPAFSFLFLSFISSLFYQWLVNHFVIRCTELSAESTHNLLTPNTENKEEIKDKN